MNDLSDLDNGIIGNTEEQDVLELTDIVENGIEKEFDKDDEIIELTTVVEDGLADDGTDLNLFTLDSNGDEPDFTEDFDFTEESEFSEDADFSEVSDIEKTDLLEDSPDIPGMKIGDIGDSKQSVQMDTDSSDYHVRLTDRQFEAALEKIIEKKFSEKIETILFEVVGKVVEKEIADIKKQLTREITKADKLN